MDSINMPDSDNSVLGVIFEFASLIPAQKGPFYSISKDTALIEGGGKRSKLLGVGLTHEEVGQFWGGN